jgi:hypothetical protein
MGRRTILKAFQVLDDADSTTLPEGPETDVSGLDFVTYTISVDSSVSAVAGVYVSRSDDKDGAYFSLDFGSPLSLNGAVDTDYIIKIENHGFKWMKINIDSSAGTGNISAWVSGNARGA